MGEGVLPFLDVIARVDSMFAIGNERLRMYVLGMLEGEFSMPFPVPAKKK